MELFEARLIRGGFIEREELTYSCRILDMLQDRGLPRSLLLCGVDVNI
jgi:hypothetical protein